MTARENWVDELEWTADGLLPVIVQDHADDRLLMFAWMNREALTETRRRGEAVYWSRSRQRLWHKGERSGHTQKVHEMRADCDRDVLLLKVEQIGDIACHTGRRSCFFHRLGDDDAWEVTEPVIKDPRTIYGKR